MAPEVLPYLRNETSSNNSYTNAVDIWSLSVMTFLLLTGETLFKDPKCLIAYVTGNFTFPLDRLHANKVSQRGCDFVRKLMQPRPEDRPQVVECQKDLWLRDLVKEFTTEGHHLPGIL